MADGSSKNGTHDRPNSMPPDVEEESQGLVQPKQSNKHSQGGISVKHQIVMVFVFTSLFMLLVGFVVGRESVSNAISNATSNKKDTDTTKGGDDEKIVTQPPEVEDKPLPFDAARLKSAKDKANEAITLLEDYWGQYASRVLYGDAGLVFGKFKDNSAGEFANEVMIGFSKPNKEATNAESFQRTVDIIARTLVHGESFKLGFIGSSVMCGHDNCYYDSFPEQLRRFIGPIFLEATGKEIEVRNGCQGGTCGDTYHNQIFCFRHIVGDDIDFLFYGR